MSHPRLPAGETANGKFPDTAVKTMAAIVANAENANGYNAMQCFIRDHSAKPFTRGETFGATVASTMVDCNAQLVIVLSQDGFAARLVSKYRPAVPTLVVTNNEHVANQACMIFGQCPVKVGLATAMCMCACESGTVCVCACVRGFVCCVAGTRQVRSAVSGMLPQFCWLAQSSEQVIKTSRVALAPANINVVLKPHI